MSEKKPAQKPQSEKTKDLARYKRELAEAEIEKNRQKIVSLKNLITRLERKI